MQKSSWLFLSGLLLVGVLVIAVFAPVRHFDFVRWDDDNNFVHNPLLPAPWSLDLTGKLFRADHAMRFMPLQWLSCRLVYGAVGLHPEPWHLVNLGWHLLATLLFALVLRRILRLFSSGAGSWADALALLAAAAWAVHPLRSEPVAWATAATYPLSGTFVLASFVCYLRARTVQPANRAWMGAAWGLAVLSYGCYPVGVTYGVWLVGFDLWLWHRNPAEEGPRQVSWWVRHALFLFPAALAVLSTVWTRYTDPTIFGAAPDLAATGLPVRLVMALSSMTALAWGLVWPVNLSPNRAPLILTSVETLALVLLAAIMGAATLLLAWRHRRRWPGVALVVLGFAALSTPCLGLTERPTWPVDRYSYLVHLILIGGLAGLLLRCPGRWHWSLAAGGLLLIGIEAVAARRVAMHWQNSETLFTQMAVDSRFADNPRQQGLVYVLWSQYLRESNSPARAAEMLNRAQAVYVGAIKAALARGDYPEALSLLSHEEHFIGLTPILRREKGSWLLKVGRPQEALAELQRASAVMPNDARTRELLHEAEAAAVR